MSVSASNGSSSQRPSTAGSQRSKAAPLTFSPTFNPPSTYFAAPLSPSRTLQLRNAINAGSTNRPPLAPKPETIAVPDALPRYVRPPRMWTSALQDLEETATFNRRYTGRACVEMPPKPFSPRLNALPTTGRPGSALLTTGGRRVSPPPARPMGMVAAATAPDDQIERGASGASERLARQMASEAEASEAAAALAAVAAAAEAAETAEAAWWAAYLENKETTTEMRRRQEDEEEEAAIRAKRERKKAQAQADDDLKIEIETRKKKTAERRAAVNDMLAKEKAKYIEIQRQEAIERAARKRSEAEAGRRSKEISVEAKSLT